MEAVLQRAQRFDHSTWGPPRLASSDRVTTSKRPPGDRERLHRVLAAQPGIRRHLCLLMHTLGYTSPRCTSRQCGGTPHACRCTFLCLSWMLCWLAPIPLSSVPLITDCLANAAAAARLQAPLCLLHSCGQSSALLSLCGPVRSTNMRCCNVISARFINNRGQHARATPCWGGRTAGRAARDARCAPPCSSSTGPPSALRADAASEPLPAPLPQVLSSTQTAWMMPACK